MTHVGLNRRRSRIAGVALLGILCASSAWGQQDPRKKPPIGAPAGAVDQAKVDAAIRKGLACLKDTAKDPNKDLGRVTGPRLHEIVLWTLQHSGVSETEPEYRNLLKMMLETELERTYNVALQAMILEDLDRVKYQTRIWQCAQFLLDNQCPNGSWGYGEPSPFTKDVAAAFQGVKATPTDVKATAKKIPRMKVPVTKRRDSTARGDNSNSQYAALGLRACHDAGIIIPPDVIDAATRYWRDGHQADPAPVKGWAYRNNGDAAYGSMTAGALGSLAIFQYLQNKPWMQDKDCIVAREWLTQNYSVTENPGHGADEYYYYLYALERAGVFFGFVKLDTHYWYAEGANAVLAAQKASGAWGSSMEHTCFAILFLRRATRPLTDVASVDRYIDNK